MKVLCGESMKINPILSNQKMNAYLKVIARVCGIEKELTFHIGRHLFATTVTPTNGVLIESVSKNAWTQKIENYATLCQRMG